LNKSIIGASKSEIAKQAESDCKISYAYKINKR